MSQSLSKPGLVATISAFAIWGFVPIFWRYLDHVPALDIMVYRCVFCLILLSPILLYTKLRNKGEEPKISRADFGRLTLSALLLAVNWFLFVYAMHSRNVLGASLGYFINPLISIALGALILRERVSPLQGWAIGAASIGILLRIGELGSLPILSLGIATTFAFYALIRKTTPINTFRGLGVETSILTILFVVLQMFGVPLITVDMATHSPTTWAFLGLSGLITLAPLALFATGAKRLPLSAIGFLQFLAPSLTFLQATLLFDEKVTTETWLTFAFVWLGVGLFSLDILMGHQRNVAYKTALDDGSAASDCETLPSASILKG